MKRFYTILLLFTTLINYGFSQESVLENNYPTYRNSFYYVPFQTFFGNFQLSYEHSFASGTKGLLFSAGIHLKGKDSNLEIGFNDEIQLRFYLDDFGNTNTGKQGKNKYAYFFSPYVAHNYRKGTSYQFDYINAVSAGILTGYRVTINRFVFDFFIGGGFKKAMANRRHNESRSDDFWDDNFTGVHPKGGANVGIKL